MVLEGRHHHGARASCGALDVRVWGIHNCSHGYQAADRNVLRSGDSDIGSGVVGVAAPHSHVPGKDSRAVNQQQRVLNRFIPEALLVSEKVRREKALGFSGGQNVKCLFASTARKRISRAVRPECIVHTTE